MGAHHWHDTVLPPRWHEAAALLDRSGVLDGFYLAGGTGLALQLGHRVSVDIDLFTPQPFDSHAVRDALRHLTEFSLVQIAPHTLRAAIATVQASFLYHDYPLLFTPQVYGTLPVADIRDIACMKLDAVSSRGSRRDFVDLYFVLRDLELRELLDWFDTKYASAAPNRIHLSKALAYFDDAELEPMPNMLIDADWNGIKRFFEDEIRKSF